MRARTFLFTMLLLLCHQQLWPQQLTKQFPPAGEENQAGTRARGATQQAQSATPNETVYPDDPSLQSTIPEAHVVPPAPAGVPVRIEAKAQTYVKTDGGGIYTLTGNVVVYYRDYVIRADHATYNQATGDITAEGGLQVDGGPDNAHLTATHGTVNVEAHTAHLYEMSGTLGQGRASGVRTVTTVIPGIGTQQQNKPVLSSESPFAVSGKELIQMGEG
ncbi:MAG: hypothetical protein JOZ33_01660, partial [Acidobacteriaceae bacterium]|nr:hypothetical protein [Acidobacteriaceae bacterium]